MSNQPPRLAQPLIAVTGWPEGPAIASPLCGAATGESGAQLDLLT
jgi:hypothetical protein